MHIRSKLFLIGLGTAMIMAVGVGSASAGRISISHGELTRLIWSSLKFQLAGITGAECPVTLEASYHSTTISKTPNTLLGYVTRASISRCITGNATILSETLPWHIQYGGFTETLPRPKLIQNLVGATFLINNPLIGTCRSRTTATEPGVAIVEPTYETGGNGIAERVRVDETKRIECVGIGRGNFAGEARSTESAGARNVLVRLI